MVITVMSGCANYCYESVGITATQNILMCYLKYICHKLLISWFIVGIVNRTILMLFYCEYLSNQILCSESAAE